ASGKILNGFHLFSKMALGADLCNSARGMMLALGCIQARRCNTNHCPAGVATSKENLIVGLVPSEKRTRVYNYHRHTLHAFAELLGASGLSEPKQISGNHIYRRISRDTVRTYAALFPTVETGAFLKGNIPANYQADFLSAHTEGFDSIKLKQAS
ncbi:MAG: hypothetical protein KDD45_15445, partial [Bdellovibrionales bacterium]|nr:hypothetical protein [Bdellovibrionales bacterium]